MNNPNKPLVAEMKALVRLAAEPRPPADSIKAALGRAAAALGIGFRRTTSLWYGYDSVRVTEAEATRLRAERDKLLVLRIERLKRDIAEAERLLAEARGRDAVAQAVVDRDKALGRGPADSLGGAGCIEA